MRNLPIVCLLLGGLVGCGKVKGATVDAPPGEDAGDDLDAPPPEPIKVTALSDLQDGAPDTSARVVLQDASGALVQEGLVNAQGEFEGMLPAEGGSVTVIRIITETATTRSVRLTTVTGVKPGDDLTVGFKASPTITNQGGQTTMTATFNPVTNATSHQFFTECGTSNAGTVSPVTLNFRDSCHGATFDMLVVASGANLVPPRFTRLTGINHANNGSFNVPNIGTTMQTFTFNVTNVPAAVNDLNVTRSSLLNNTPVARQTTTVGDPVTATVATSVPFPQGVGTRAELEIQFQREDAARQTQIHSVRTANLLTSADIDLGANEIPVITDMTISATGLAWRNVAPGDAPDGMLMLWQGRWSEAGIENTVEWRVAQAYDPAATSVTLPSLPPKFAEFDPGQQTATIQPRFGGVIVADYDVIAGYDAYRPVAETLSGGALSRVGGLPDGAVVRRIGSASAIVNQGKPLRSPLLLDAKQ